MFFILREIRYDKNVNLQSDIFDFIAILDRIKFLVAQEMGRTGIRLVRTMSGVRPLL